MAQTNFDVICNYTGVFDMGVLCVDFYAVLCVN